MADLETAFKLEHKEPVLVWEERSQFHAEWSRNEWDSTELQKDLLPLTKSHSLWKQCVDGAVGEDSKG